MYLIKRFCDNLWVVPNNLDVALTLVQGVKGYKKLYASHKNNVYIFIILLKFTIQIYKNSAVEQIIFRAE
jgi:hypothetical protein